MSSSHRQVRPFATDVSSRIGSAGGRGTGLLLLAALATSGCAAAVRLGVGPCVDTDGNPGFDVTLTWGMGPGGDGAGILATGTLGGGMSGEPLSGSLVTGFSIEGIHAGFDEPIAVQAGLLFSTRTLFREENEGHFGFGANVGASWIALSHRARRRNIFTRTRHMLGLLLGVLAQGEVLWVRGEAIGYFSFPVILQFFAST